MDERLLHVQLGCEISRLSHVTFNAVFVGSCGCLLQSFFSGFVLFVVLFLCLFVCVEVLWPCQPNGAMSSIASLSNHTFRN